MQIPIGLSGLFKNAKMLGFCTNLISSGYRNGEEEAPQAYQITSLSGCSKRLRCAARKAFGVRRILDIRRSDERPKRNKVDESFSATPSQEEDWFP